MHIYFSGVGGVGIGPLARIAKDAGYHVSASDKVSSGHTEQLIADGIQVFIGQDHESIAEIHKQRAIDWLVHTSALPVDHPELAFAKANSIKTSKRDELLNFILDKHQLPMLAVAGTHGKTNTTGMIIWALNQLRIPVSYSIGTQISFGPNGRFDPNSKLFIYEADEFDKNFLNFHPKYSIITTVDHDHVETYPTINDYKQAFRQYIDQSYKVYTWKKVVEYLELNSQDNVSLIDGVNPHLSLPGQHTRENASLVINCLSAIFPDLEESIVVNALNSFVGTQRRMEKLADNLYSDYAHTPVEITAAIQKASEIGTNVVVVYQPHQNVRQHQIINQYEGAFDAAKAVYWLPTYLSREDPTLELLKPDDFIDKINHPQAKTADMNSEMIDLIQSHQSNNDLVLALSAGDLDPWLRANL